MIQVDIKNMLFLISSIYFSVLDLHSPPEFVVLHFLVSLPYLFHTLLPNYLTMVQNIQSN